MKPLIFALCVVFASSNLFAQKPGWQPAPGHTQVPIWTGTPPDAQFGPPSNTETVPEPGEVDNVSRPTMTVHSPKGMALEDAQRTVGLVRFRAAEYHIDPHKIGVLGFSAGGHLVEISCCAAMDRARPHSGGRM